MRHHISEAQALERDPTAVRVPGSMVLRDLPETEDERWRVVPGSGWTKGGRVDIAALKAAIPSPADYGALDIPGQKVVAQDFMRRVLDALQSERREPDNWEEAYLSAALGLMAGAMYTAAIAFTDIALTPVDERIDEPFEEVTRLQLHDLQRGLADVTDLPAMRHR